MLREIEFEEFDLLRYSPIGNEWLLVYNDTEVKVLHGAGSTTGCGIIGATMLVGTEAELRAEIKHLDLQDIDYEEN